MPEFSIQYFGGINENDQANALVPRSYVEGESGYQQRASIESPQMINIDYDTQGIRTRLGSLEDANLTSILVTAEVLVAGCEWINPSTNVRVEIVVGKKSIYLKSSPTASWAQINDSGGSAYTHSDGSVAKCSFVEVDGHLFIGLDGTNRIQVYLSGANLSPQMVSGNTYTEAFGAASTHVMTGTWPTAAYLLSTINSRLIWSTGNTLVEFSPMARTSSSGVWDYAGSTSGFYQAAGSIKAFIPFTPNLADSFTELLYIGTSQGMEVLSGFSTTDKLVRIQGSQSPLNHMAFAKCQNWVVYLTESKSLLGINGMVVINLGRRLKTTEVDGILDLLQQSASLTYAFGFYDPVRFQALFFFCTQSTYINDQCVCVDFKLGEPIIGEAQNEFEQRVRLLHWKIDSPNLNPWFVCVYKRQNAVLGLTQTGRIFTVNSGNFDLSSISTTAITGITFSSTADAVVTLNAHGYSTGDIVKFASVVGATFLNGNSYFITVLTANTFSLDDTDTSEYSSLVWTSGGTVTVGKKILSSWKSPVFYGGSQLLTVLKEWLRIQLRAIPLGDWLLYVDTYLDLDSEAERTFSFDLFNSNQSLFDVAYFDQDFFASSGIVKGLDRVGSHSEAYQIKVYNLTQNTPFILTSVNLIYNVGALTN